MYRLLVEMLELIGPFRTVALAKIRGRRVPADGCGDVIHARKMQRADRDRNIDANGKPVRSRCMTASPGFPIVMFGHMLSFAVATARRHQRRCAVMFVDLDRF